MKIFENKITIGTSAELCKYTIEKPRFLRSPLAQPRVFYLPLLPSVQQMTPQFSNNYVLLKRDKKALRKCNQLSVRY